MSCFAGADTDAGDAFYAAYFVHYAGNGTYSVDITAEYTVASVTPLPLRLNGAYDTYQNQSKITCDRSGSNINECSQQNLQISYSKLKDTIQCQTSDTLNIIFLPTDGKGFSIAIWLNVGDLIALLFVKTALHVNKS